MRYQSGKYPAQDRIETFQCVKLDAPALMKCPKCGEYKAPHRVCDNCGYYNGREVIKKEA